MVNRLVQHIGLREAKLFEREDILLGYYCPVESTHFAQGKRRKSVSLLKNWWKILYGVHKHLIIKYSFNNTPLIQSAFPICVPGNILKLNTFLLTPLTEFHIFQHPHISNSKKLNLHGEINLCQN